MLPVKELQLQHSDCRNFCSVDVAKGICRRTKDMVTIDSNACECFVKMAKCKFCANFSHNGDPAMGVCKAEAGEPWAYAEMIAVTCEMFQPA